MTIRWKLASVKRSSGVLLSLLLVLPLMLTAQSCSWITYFVVVNYTTDPVSVRYTVDASLLWPERRDPACLLAPPFLDAPTVFPADRLKKEAILKSMKPATDFTLNEESCTIHVQLEPAQGVVVWEAVTYGGGDVSSGTGFITALDLVGSDSTVTYRGPGLERQFTRQSRVLYALTYGERRK